MKAVVAFNQEKALVGVFSVITNLRMELFEALVDNGPAWHVTPPGDSAVGTVSGVSMVSIVSILSTLAQSQFPGAGIKEAANLGPARATTPALSAQY